MKKYWITTFFMVLAHVCTSQTLEVMTYNIRLETAEDGVNQWQNRKDFLAKQVLFYLPDVIGIQEGLPQQVDFLDSAFVGYDYVGVGRDDGKRSGEFSAIFYQLKKLKLLQQSTFWLSETPDTVSKGWDAAIVRICTYALFETQDGNTRFYVFNTHFDHIGQLAREKSAELIWKKISSLNTENYPVILMGDFNSEPGDSPVKFLSSVMNDSFSASSFTFGPDGTFNGFEFCKPVTSRIDYVFVSKENVVITRYAVLSDSKNCHYPSDHLPVLVNLKLQ